MHTDPRLLLSGAKTPNEDEWPESKGSLPPVQGQGHRLEQPLLQGDTLVAELAVVIGAVSLDVDAAHAVAQLEALIILAVRGLAPAAACGLQQGVIRDTGGLVQ